MTIECFRFKEKYAALIEGREFNGAVENPYYLLAIFDAIMNTMTKANGKKVSVACVLKWPQHNSVAKLMCSHLLSSSFHTDLDVQVDGYVPIS